MRYSHGTKSGSLFSFCYTKSLFEMKTPFCIYSHRLCTLVKQFWTKREKKKTTNGIHQEANRLIRTVTRSLREIYRGGRDRMKPQCLTCFLMCPMAQRSHLMWCQSALSTHFAWTHLVSNYSPASLAVFWFSTLPFSIPNRLRFCLLCCLPSVKKPRHLWSL